MINIPKNNGLIFYPVLSDKSTPSPVNRNDLPASSLRRSSWLRFPVKDQQKFYMQFVDYNDISRVQVISDDILSIEIYNSSDTLIDSGTWNTIGTIDDINVQVSEIDWNSFITDVEEIGNYIIIHNDDDHYYRSEPLIMPTEYPMVKIEYSNNANNIDYGSFQDCFEHIHYSCGQLMDDNLPSNEFDFEDSGGKIITLMHDHRDSFLYETPFIATKFARLEKIILNHDYVKISQKIDGFTVSENLQLPLNETALIENHPTVNIAKVSSMLNVVNSFVRRLPSQVNQNLPLSPVLLPETDKQDDGFTINWESQVQADSYNVELSDTSDFSNILISANTENTSYVFSGLTACNRYYYRVNSQNCEGVGSWSINTSIHEIKLHLRGESNYRAFSFDEKIRNITVNNILGLAESTRYKLAITANEPTKLDWDNSYSYLSLTQLAEAINNIDIGVDPIYWVYLDVTGYSTSKQDACINFKYVSSSFYILVNCLIYPYDDSISNDIMIGFEAGNEYPFFSLVKEEGTGNTNIYHYNVITSSSDDFTSFPYNSTPNSVIESNAGQEMIVSIWAEKRVPTNIKVSYKS